MTVVRLNLQYVPPEKENFKQIYTVNIYPVECLEEKKMAAEIRHKKMDGQYSYSQMVHRVIHTKTKHLQGTQRHKNNPLKALNNRN